MSSWYLFNALGLYPVNPASAEYIIGSPAFDEVRVTFPGSEQQLVVRASGALKSMYVRSVSLDGANLTSPVVTHAELIKARELTFDMSGEPQPWGSNVL